jgi:phospholipid transport system transporter-binding protein
MKIESASFTNANAAELAEQGCAALRAGETEFDLSAVKEVDSATVATLLAWRRTAQQLGVKLKLIGMPAPVASLATLYGVDGLLGTPHQESIAGHVEHGEHSHPHPDRSG